VSLEWVYLQTLPEDKQAALKEPDAVTKDDVRRVVKRTIQMLRSPDQKRRRPILAVRNLYTMLDDEKFSNAEKLNDALWPHWKALWRVCARGHYAVHKKPLREEPIAQIDNGDFEFPIQRDLVRDEGNEFIPRLLFPGPLMPRYPVFGYPRIAEFRRMLELLDLEPAMTQWKGYYFIAWTGIMENEERGVSFRSSENGISFNFPMDQWKAIQSLFRRAWQSPEVASAWDALVLQYGEL